MEKLKKLISRPKEPTWDQYLYSLTKQPQQPTWLSHELFLRLKEWLLRFDIHQENQSNRSFRRLNKWRNKNKLSREGNKLKKALEALQELKTSHLDNKNAVSDSSPYQDMINTTLKMINIEMTKLEISQLRMLERAQNLRREISTTNAGTKNKFSLEEKALELKILRQEIHQVIEGRAKRFSIIVKEDHPELLKVYSFFHTNEKKIHFRKHFQRADKVSSTLNVFSAFNHLEGSIAAFIPVLIRFLLEIGHVLQAIPFINAITSAIPIIIRSAKVWIRNKSTSKKTLSILALAIVLGGFITMGFATLTAAGVAVGLMITGSTVQHFYPWGKMLFEIHNKEKELRQLQINTASPEKDSHLKQQEKQFLMIKVEKAWVKSNLSSDDLKKLKKLIMDPEVTINKLVNSHLMTLINIQDVNNFFKEAKEKRKEHLTQDISKLRQEESDKRVRVVNCTVAIIGAILICVPTPITMLIGASLLMISAVMGLATTYQLGAKLTHLKDRLFSNKNLQSVTSLKNLSSSPQYNNSDGLINNGLDKLSEENPPRTPSSPDLTNKSADDSETKNIELEELRKQDDQDREGEGKSTELGTPIHKP